MSNVPASVKSAVTPTPLAPAVAISAALAPSGPVKFWSDCQFVAPARAGAYECHRITLSNVSNEGFDALAAVVEPHYVEPSSFRSAAGGDALARVLEACLPDRADTPNAKKDRAGDLGEMLAIEWLRRTKGNEWEVCCTLRWKESIRPRRGEDLIAVKWGASPVGLMKGEAKAGCSISGQTVTEARERLNLDGGWPAPFTINFLATKLDKDGRVAEATRLFKERFENSPRPNDAGCAHFVFLLSATDPTAFLTSHGAPPAGTVHVQLAATLVCGEYERLRDTLHQRAIELARARATP